MPARPLEFLVAPDAPTIVTRRVVAAPRALVFEAFTTAAHLARWLGPHALTLVVDRHDLRVGGSYRFVHRAADGQEVAFHGTYREIVRPERLVRTWVFEPLPEDEAVETTVLATSAGLTTITTTSVHRTIAARDLHVAGGDMQAGMVEAYERLDELLVELQATSGRR